MKSVYLFFVTLLVASCGDSADPLTGTEPSETAPTYTVIEQDLQFLKDAFNANQGRVRLMFLSGPTCGICLRGMADLNDAFLAEHQNDERLVTFVVHVPTMGAKEKHVAETIPLLNGPRIHHYWEDTGIIGQHYREIMDVDHYVWDFWAIYGPDVIWDGMLPPDPEYFEHQLGVTSGRYRTFPKGLVLDADRFATKTLGLVNSIDGSNALDPVSDQADFSNLVADGTEISVVGQPRNVAVRRHILGRGGYKNLKRIQSVVANGHLESGGQRYELAISATRPNEVRRALLIGGELSIAEQSDGEVLVEPAVNRGVPAEVEQQILKTFEFDGLFVEWPDKGHEVSMKGMRKFNDILAWKLKLQQKNGPAWNLFLNSHSGNLIQKHMLDENGEPTLIIRQSDFRDVDGFRFPFRIEYMDGNSNSIAVEVIDSIAIEVDPFEVENEAISH
jgi:hypothetical protein